MKVLEEVIRKNQGR